MRGRRGGGGERARKGNMMKWGNKENPRTQEACKWKRSQKRQMGHEWMQIRCKEAWRRRMQHNQVMERQSHIRMSNDKFIPGLHLLHLTSLHSPRRQTALHQHEMRLLHFPWSLKTDLLLKRKVCRWNKTIAQIIVFYVTQTLIIFQRHYYIRLLVSVQCLTRWCYYEFFTLQNLCPSLLQAKWYNTASPVEKLWRHNSHSLSHCEKCLYIKQSVSSIQSLFSSHSNIMRDRKHCIALHFSALKFSH